MPPSSILTGIGLILFTGIAFTRTTKHQIRNWQFAGCLCSITHYLALGLLTPAGINSISMAINLALGTRDKTTDIPKWILPVSILTYIAVAIFTWKDWTSTLPTTAQIVGAIGTYYKNPKTVIATKVATEPLWLIFNTINAAWFPFFASCALILGGSIRLTNGTPTIASALIPADFWTSTYEKWNKVNQSENPDWNRFIQTELWKSYLTGQLIQPLFIQMSIPAGSLGVKEILKRLNNILEKSKATT